MAHATIYLITCLMGISPSSPGTTRVHRLTPLELSHLELIAQDLDDGERFADLDPSLSVDLKEMVNDPSLRPARSRICLNTFGHRADLSWIFQESTHRPPQSVQISERQ